MNWGGYTYRVGAVTLIILVAVSDTKTTYQQRKNRFESLTSCFLAEYVRWRKLEQVILFQNPAVETVDLVKGLNRRGVYVGLQHITDPQLSATVTIPRHRLGAVILIGSQVSSVEEEFMELVSQKQLFYAYVSWLIITETNTPAVDSNSTIEERLRYFNIGLDTDLTIATKMRTTEENISSNIARSRTRRWGDRNVATDNYNDGSYKPWNWGSSDSGDNLSNGGSHINEKRNSRDGIQKTEKRGKNNRNYNKKNRNYRFKEMQHCRENSNRAEYAGLEFSLLQVYKIRSNSNSSLIVIPLGSWNAMNGTSNLKPPNGIEQRNDFRGLPLFVGVKNASQVSVEVARGNSKGTAQSSDDDFEDDNHLMDVLDFIARSLNASYELVPFTKLGWQNEERAWLFMLGAVTGGTVDLGLDNVVITPERYRDMFFTLPIVQSMYDV